MDVDLFAQEMLQKAEKRSRALGISSVTEDQINKCYLKQSKDSFNDTYINLDEKENLPCFKASSMEYKISNAEDEVDVDIEIKVKSDQVYEVRIEVEEQQDDSKSVTSVNEKNAEIGIRDCSRNRLKRLGALYSNADDLSSPIHRTEEQFCSENKKENENVFSKNKFGKLAALANSISQWEEENNCITVCNQTTATISSQKKYGEIHKGIQGGRNDQSNVTKKLNWDPNVMNSLQAQGFQRRESEGIKYSYDYASMKNKEPNLEAEFQSKQEKNRIQLKSGLVSCRAALFENQELLKKNEIEKCTKDPIELSLKERRQLFETKRGNPPMPKAPLAIAPSISKIIECLKKDDIKEPTPILKSLNVGKGHQLNELEISDNAGIDHKSISKNSQYSEINLSNAGLSSNKSVEINNLSPLIKERPKQPPPPPPEPEVPSTSIKRPSSSSNDEIKRARNEVDSLYPVLSINNLSVRADPFCGSSTISARSNNDDESSLCSLDNLSLPIESKCEDFTNFGNKKNCLNKYITDTKVSERNDLLDKDESLVNHNFSSSSLGVDDFIDEALNDTDDFNDNFKDLSCTNAGTITSNSFSFRRPNISENSSSVLQINSIMNGNKNSFTQPVKSELKINEANDNMVTLIHTVSFYRKQQTANQVCSTPNRPTHSNPKELFLENEYEKNSSKILAECPEVEDDVSEYEDGFSVEEKIKRLLEEVCKQQQIIAQTSQALNLCAATVEFSGSTESVEGERHLLVATHRRQTCLDEIQRLRVERRVRPLAAPKEKGRLTVKEITLPLRNDYIRKLSSDTISGHHLVCLLKYNEHVLSTKTVPTLPGLLAVKFPDVLVLDNVYADFRVTLEIFGMTAQREVLPHEVKYHININKKNGVKTPKRKGSESRLIMPPVQSPAGPQAVRTPALVQYGFAIFSLREIQRTSWTLTQVLGVSPLEGILHMKVNCELSVSVEHKGFLTMFEDISGLGAWHRRWCFLNGTILNYWKYPDDEKRKTPMGSIDLYACVSQKVSVVPRDICARLNTLLLECERPYKPSDKESLILIPKGKITTVRYLLSADTKEEREEWCAFLNKSLTLLRAWGPPQ